MLRAIRGKYKVLQSSTSTFEMHSDLGGISIATNKEELFSFPGLQ